MFELNIERTFNTSVEKLFEAWCKPEILQQWFAPGKMTVPEASADVREGGSYRIVMHDSDENSNHIVGGKYQKVIANQALEFTWQWEGNPIATKVALVFKALSDNTAQLQLTHTEFANQEDCDKHEMGWNGCLVKLEKVA